MSLEKQKTQAIDVRYVAHLARLNLTDDEASEFESQIGRIVEYFGELRAIDVEAVEPTAHAAPISNVFRDDVVRPSLAREEALANAPEAAGDLFSVPQIVE